MLIKARHAVTIYSADRLTFECHKFYQQYKLAIDSGEVSVFNKTPFGSLISLVWSELIPVDRKRVREWACYIFEGIANEINN